MTILCFAIWCKMQHSNSIMFDMGTRQLMRTLHISQPKAQLLLNAIKTDDLFSVKENGRFIVTSFKDDTRKLDKNTKFRQHKVTMTFSALMFRFRVLDVILIKELLHLL